MTGLILDLKVFACLIQEFLPKIAKHLNDINVEPVLFAVQWFLCIFSYNLPVESVIRVWDVFFCEGHKYLFSLGLAVLKIYRKTIFGFDNFNFAAEFLGTMSNNLKDFDLLIETASIYEVSQTKIDELRQKFYQKIDFQTNLNLYCQNDKSCKYLQSVTSDYFTFTGLSKITINENYFDSCEVSKSYCTLSLSNHEEILVASKNHFCANEVPKTPISDLFNQVYKKNMRIIMPRITLSPFFLQNTIKEIIEVKSLD